MKRTLFTLFIFWLGCLTSLLLYFFMVDAKWDEKKVEWSEWSNGKLTAQDYNDLVDQIKKNTSDINDISNNIGQECEAEAIVNCSSNSDCDNGEKCFGAVTNTSCSARYPWITNIFIEPVNNNFLWYGGSLSKGLYFFNKDNNWTNLYSFYSVADLDDISNTLCQNIFDWKFPNNVSNAYFYWEGPKQKWWINFGDFKSLAQEVRGTSYVSDTCGYNLYQEIDSFKRDFSSDWWKRISVKIATKTVNSNVCASNKTSSDCLNEWVLWGTNWSDIDIWLTSKWDIDFDMCKRAQNTTSWICVKN